MAGEDEASHSSFLESHVHGASTQHQADQNEVPCATNWREVSRSIKNPNLHDRDLAWGVATRKAWTMLRPAALPLALPAAFLQLTHGS